MIIPQKHSSEHVSVSSLRPDCLQNIRFSNQQRKTHLLAYMSQYIEDYNEIPVEQVDQLCCYDRMKRLIQKQKQNNLSTDYQSKLEKAIQIESKINLLQKQLNKVKENKQKKPQKSLNKRICYNRKQIINQLKNKSYDNFINQYKNCKENNLGEIKIQIQKEIQKKVNKIIDERNNSYNKLLKEKQQTERKILQQNLYIEQLKSEIVYLKQNQQGGHSVSNIETEANKQQFLYESWYQEFNQYFPGITVFQVKKDMQILVDKCLRKLQYVQQKQQSQWLQSKKQYEQKIKVYQKQISILQKQLQQLKKQIQQYKQLKSLKSLQTDLLVKSRQKLQNLQKIIQSIYNQWHGLRNQSEKQMLKNLGYFKQDYQYQQMLKYILNYKNNFSTNQKLNQYIIKLLRCIHKIKKIILPQSNNQKLDPFTIFQQIQKWVKNKMLYDNNWKNIKPKYRNNSKKEQNEKYLKQN